VVREPGVPHLAIAEFHLRRGDQGELPIQITALHSTRIQEAITCCALDQKAREEIPPRTLAVLIPARDAVKNVVLALRKIERIRDSKNGGASWIWVGRET
jgi:hypothetical protein